MSQLINLTKRNIKVYFSDKGMFFTSLITPIILLVLYATFLANVYRDSFLSAIPDGFELSNKLINALVSGQLMLNLFLALDIQAIQKYFPTPLNQLFHY